jgi:hypothetical protein
MFYRPARRRRPQPTATPTTPGAPLALTDEQLRAVMDMCGQIPPSMRSAYLETLAARLRGIERGDGAVHRCATQLAREMLASTGAAPWAGDGTGDPEDGLANHSPE